jgi:hypothetical protein
MASATYRAGLAAQRADSRPCLRHQHRTELVTAPQRGGNLKHNRRFSSPKMDPGRPLRLNHPPRPKVRAARAGLITGDRSHKDHQHGWIGLAAHEAVFLDRVMIPAGDEV